MFIREGAGSDMIKLTQIYSNERGRKLHVTSRNISILCQMKMKLLVQLKIISAYSSLNNRAFRGRINLIKSNIVLSQ